MDNEQEKLIQIAKILNPDKILSVKEIEQVLLGVVGILGEYKSSTLKLNKETKDAVSKILDTVMSEHADCIQQIEEKNKKLLDQVKKISDDLGKSAITMAQVKETFDGMIETRIAQDRASLSSEIISNIKFPEYEKVTLDGAMEIANKLESLDGADRLKASAISGLEELIDARIARMPRVGGNTIGGGVTQIKAGTGVTIDSTGSNGRGVVTINASSTGSGVELGGSQVNFDPGMVQYIAQDGLQYGDAGFTRNSSTLETIIDTGTGFFRVGDLNDVAGSAKIIIDNFNSDITVAVKDTFGVYDPSGGTYWFHINMVTGTQTLGDFSHVFNGTKIAVNDGSKFIDFRADGSFNFANANGEQWGFISPEARIVKFGDFDLVSNHTYTYLDDDAGLFMVFGNRNIPIPAITYSSVSGQDDLSLVTTVFVGANNTSNTAIIDGVNIQQVTYVLDGGSPDFQVGDTITGGTSGETGVVAYMGINGTLYLDFATVTGVFTNGEPISGDLSAATATSGYFTTGGRDSFSWTDGTTTYDHILCDTNPYNLGSGVFVSFGSETGHQLGDQWDWTFALTYGEMLSLDGANRVYGIGDLGDIGLGTKIQITDGTQAIRFIYGASGYTFPIGDGGAGEIIATDGAGNLYWASGTSIPFLNDMQVGVGDGSNQLSSSQNFVWDYNNFILNVGDLGSSGNDTSFLLDDTTSQVRFATGDFKVTDTSLDQVIYASGPNKEVRLGDVNQSRNETTIRIDDIGRDVEVRGDGTVRICNILNQNVFETGVGSGNFYAAMGDIGGFGNQTSFILDDSAQSMVSRLGGQMVVTNTSGNILLDIEASSNPLINLGDVSVVFNGVAVQIDDGNKLITANSRGNGTFIAGDVSANGNGQRLRIDDANSTTSIGDFGNQVNGTSTIWEDGTKSIFNIVDTHFTIQNTGTHRTANFATGSYSAIIGDVDDQAGHTKLIVDDVTTTIQLLGGMVQNYVAKTATYSVLRKDYAVDCTSGTFTVTLPTAAGFAGQIYVIKNSGAGVITIATTSSQTIDGATTQTLATKISLTMMSNGANWIII